jgi:hypothetical protein
MKVRALGLLTMAAITVINAASVWGRNDATTGRDFESQTALPAAELPCDQNRVHRVGNIAFTITNYGVFGSQARGFKDFCTGLPAESFEFPINSNVEYLFQGALWLGAVKDGKDTLVSLGEDGWSSANEMFSLPCSKGGGIIERTTRGTLRQAPNATCADVKFSEDAVSEQDFIAVYYDTVTSLGTGGGQDGSRAPVGVEITQKSYSWSFDYAQDFILMELGLRNVLEDTVRELYYGLYMDHDVGSQSAASVYTDDITGYTHSIVSPAGPDYRDTVNLAWIADNDGDPNRGAFYFASVTGISGIRVIKAPTPDLKFSFNWWVSNSNAAEDWGPVKVDSKVEFPHSGLGTPTGDRAKYQIMSNGEFDYPEYESALFHEAEGWLPPPTRTGLAEDLANGFDTRYLLSFGPFDLPPDSSLPLTIAFVAGADFHVDPDNFNSFFDPADPEPYVAGLNFEDFGLNALWAGWVYDTPGYDTDGNGTRGNSRIIGRDTIYYTGDGVPDYQGPPPPPSPFDLRFQTFEGKIVMRWNGHRSETFKDPFSLLPDFEGYRVYMSRTLTLSDFALLTQRDNINYVRYQWKPEANRWKVTDPPFTLDSLRALYDSLSVSVHNYPFHPDSFRVRSLDEALMQVVLDDIDPSRLDTSYFAFGRFDANETVDDKLYSYWVDSLGLNQPGKIRRVNPYLSVTDSILQTDGSWFFPYYEYEVTIDGLALAEPVILAVTAFDYGNPAADLSQLESSPLSNATEVWPINSAEVVKTERPKPGVYPNPYRLYDDYGAQGWEDASLGPEYGRKITFTNIPDTCTVSIWTLDGDLVRKLDHAENPGNSQASVVVWNLITRNTQAAKTGIYLYTIESKFGTDVGKLVIIK